MKIEEFIEKYPDTIDEFGQISLDKIGQIFKLMKEFPTEFPMYQDIIEDFKLLDDDYRIKKNFTLL